MAVVLIEGFDHLTAAESTNKGWTNVWQNTLAGRFDGQSAQMPVSTTKVLPSTYATLIVGGAFKTDTLTSGQVFLTLRAGATNTCQVTLDASNHIQIKNSSGTVIATGTTVLAINTWYYIEVKVFINGASGTVEVHLNGASGEIASTVGNFGSTNLDTVALGRMGTGAVSQVDDLYAVDTSGSAPRNTFLGDVRVETIYPTADGAHTQWTPNSGSTHYTQVDEAQADGDTTYVSDNTAGHIDSYTFGDIDTAATVYGVQTNLYARKDDAATRQIAPVIRQSGTDNVGTTVTLGTTYLDYTQIYNQDPTSADWTPTTVNADEFGVKEIA